MSIVSNEAPDDQTIVYEHVTGLVHEPNFAVVNGRAVEHPEGKVVETPRYVRPKAKTIATTKTTTRPRPQTTKE